MKDRRSVVWRAVLLLCSAVLLFGFRFQGGASRESRVNTLEQTELEGWVEVMILSDGLIGSGTEWVQYTVHPVQILLPIHFSGNPDGFGVIDSVTSYTYAEGLFEWQRGLEITGSMFVIEKYVVNGLLYPAPICSLELYIDAYWLLGMVSACSPIVGCIAEPIMPEMFPDIDANFPRGEGFYEVQFEAQGVSAYYRVILLELFGPDRACDYHFYLP